MRRLRLEIAIDGERIVAASCCETTAPLRGFWRRWTMLDQTASETITRAAIVAGLRDVINHPTKDNRHG